MELLSGIRWVRSSHNIWRLHISYSTYHHVTLSLYSVRPLTKSGHPSLVLLVHPGRVNWQAVENLQRKRKAQRFIGENSFVAARRASIIDSLPGVIRFYIGPPTKDIKWFIVRPHTDLECVICETRWKIKSNCAEKTICFSSGEMLMDPPRNPLLMRPPLYRMGMTTLHKRFSLGPSPNVLAVVPIKVNGPRKFGCPANKEWRWCGNGAFVN